MNESPATDPQKIKPIPQPIDQKAADAEERLRADFVPATLQQKISLAVLLIVATTFVVVIWFHNYEHFRDLSDTPVAVNWTPADSQALKATSAGFRCDAEKGKLLMVGLPDTKRFDELRTLLVDKQT